MPSSGELVFSTSPWLVSCSIVFVGLVVVVALLAWYRSGWRASIGWLEGLRIVVAIGIALTLNKPEWRETFEPDERPMLAVLHDVSRSMETKDVLEESGEGTSVAAKPRAEAVEPLIDPTIWEAVQGRMDVVIEPFSSGETPANEGTNVNGALLNAMESQANLRAVVLLSDGDWNTGVAPSQAATQLRMKEIPVLAVSVGAETRLPDLEVTSFDVPTFAVLGKPVRIPFTIESSLPRDQVLGVTMKTSAGEEVRQEWTVPAMGRLQEALSWRPSEAGSVKLSLEVDSVPMERNMDNNAAEAELEIREEQLRVLVIESLPRWEYRYLRNALERDPGVQVETLLFHPDLDKVGAGRGYLNAFPADDVLAQVDVVFLGDVGADSGMLTGSQCEALVKLVRDQASGLVFLPGPRGYMASLWETPLAELLPVVWDVAQPRGWGTAAPGRFTLTEAGTASLLTKLEDEEEASASVWSTLPGFQWYAPALRAKAGTEVLATHASESNAYGRVPLIVTRTYGAGKILYMGADGAWRWRRGVEDRYHYRFWGQVARWMAYQRNMAQGEKMRLFFSPDRPRTGSTVTLNANVMSLTGEPLRDGAVVAQIVAPSGNPESIRLLPAGEESWGLFTGIFTPDEPGEHAIRLTSAEAGASLDASIAVQGTRKEKVGKPARPEVMREIAQLTRGEWIQDLDPAAVIESVSAIPEPDAIERRVPLWAHPVWAAALILLLSGFWIGRKAAGVF